MKNFAAVSFAISILGGLAALPLPAQAQNFLVNWDGAYLDHETGGQKLTLGPESSIRDASQKVIGVGFSWSEDTPIAPKSPKYNSTRASALFHGALQVINASAASADDFPTKVRPMSQVTAAYGKNTINLGSTAAEEGSPARLTGFLFWPKKSFQGDPAKPIGWSEVLAVDADITKINTKPGPAEARILVRSSGKWYVSESSTDKPGLLRLTDGDWGEWNVGASFPLPAVPKTFRTKSTALTDITAVGIYFDVTSSIPLKNAVFSIKAFQVETSRPPNKP